MKESFRRWRWRAWAVPKSPREIHHAIGLLGNLRSAGWAESAKLGLPVDGDGRPVPWYTHGAICWLANVIRGTERVFEYGAGHSSLWYEQHVREVISVEHDCKWAHQVSGAAARRALHVHHFPDSQAYVDSIGDFGGTYDIIVVDGIRRSECLLAAPQYLNSGGAILLDDASRFDYRPALVALAERGFQRLDFHGIEVMGPKLRCTSVLSRSFDRWMPSADADMVYWPDVFEKRLWSATPGSQGSNGLQ